MNKVHIYEVEQIIVEFKRNLKPSFVSKNISDACRFVAALLVLDMRYVLHFYKSHQKHLPHLDLLNCNKAISSQVVCKIDYDLSLHSHFSLLPTDYDQIVVLTIWEHKSKI